MTTFVTATMRERNNYSHKHAKTKDGYDVSYDHSHVNYQEFSSGKQAGNHVNATDYSGVKFYSPHGTFIEHAYRSRRKNYVEDIDLAVVFPSSPYNSDPGASSIRPRFSSQNQMNRATTECLAKFSGSGLNVGVTLAESAKTASWLANSSIDLFSALRDIKKGNLEALKKRFDVSKKDIPKTASERWLEYNYAVLPLMNDIHGVAELYNDGLKKESLINHRRTVKHKSSMVGSLGLQRQTYDATEWYRCNITARVTDESLQAAKLLGLVNVAEIAWELVPFSFVLDWGLPIGTWLRALSGPIGLQFVRGHQSVKSKVSITAVRTVTPFCKADGLIESYGRKPLGSFPTPLPYVKNPLSPSHSASALALLTVLTRR